jgi:hypothetical protein
MGATRALGGGRLAGMSDLAPTRQKEHSDGTWFLRALVVLQAPRPVFAALRDDSAEASSARAEPVLALAILAGMGMLLLTPEASTVLDSSDYDWIVFAIWLFTVGSVMGAFVIWAVGGLLYLAATWLGSLGSYRRARHVVAYALAPLALSLVVMLPLRLALFGRDTFLLDGSDSGGRGLGVALLGWGFAAWSVVLLLVGVRAVHAWTWARAAAAVALVALGIAVLTALRLAVSS